LIKKIKYYKDSLLFKGLRKDVPQPDGSTRKLYTVSCMVSINDKENDSDVAYYDYFDDKSRKLLYIISSKSYERISE
jgi:hypothetical protein